MEDTEFKFHIEFKLPTSPMIEMKLKMTEAWNDQFLKTVRLKIYTNKLGSWGKNIIFEQKTNLQ